MIKNIKLWSGIAIATMVISIIIIGFFPPVLGIDFTGGSLVEVTSEQIDLPAIRQESASILGSPITAQLTQDNSVLLRTDMLSPEKHAELIDGLKEKGLVTEELRFESIGPTIGAELRSKAWIAISLAIVGIIAYLAYEFRQISGLVKPWKFGVAAVLAMVHDLLLVTALFGIFGRYFGAPIDILYITAVLAIMGYSVNDTIIIFNRTRNEWFTSRRDNLLDVMDRATKLTIIRSLNTSFTTLIALIALLFLGGTTIRWFIVALTIGIAVGTYSSIFVAPPLLYLLSRSKATYTKKQKKGSKPLFSYTLTAKPLK